MSGSSIEGRTVTTEVNMKSGWSNIRFNDAQRWLWVPAFAGTTRVLWRFEI